MPIAHGQRIVEAGSPLRAARAAMVLLHGRGATAEDIMTIGSEVQMDGWAYLAPQAADNTWYPNPFTSPLEANEPYLTAALDTVTRVVERAETHVPAHRIVLLGFSQGACLTLEWSARHARRYGLLAGLPVLDDVAVLEQDGLQDRPPLRFAPGKELERHREVLELLLLRILHDRVRLAVALEREPLLVPPDRLRLLLERGDDAGESADLGAQFPSGFVILLRRHIPSTRRGGQPP